MAQPEPNEDEDPATPDDTFAGSNPVAKPDWLVGAHEALESEAGSNPVAKPDWLVGAHEALESEFGRSADDPGQAPPELRSATPIPPRQPSGPRPVNPYEGFAQSAAGRSFSSNWMETGLSSPASPQAQVSRKPEDERDPDDPFGHGQRLEDAPPPEEDPAGPEASPAATEKARWSPPPPPPKPWWEPPLAWAMTPPGRLVMGVAVIAAVGAGLLLRPRDNTVPLARIRHNAQQYDGQQVTVRGKIGEAYPVGGGYSFYLLQGRDTIVVFTRSRTPVSNDRVSIKGVVSTGVLNGEVRQALLENSP